MSKADDNSSSVPPATLLNLIIGYMPARVVHVAAHLGIADLLAGGAKTATALAQETNTSSGPLLRLLRALASMGLLENLESDRFSLTATGDQLRSNVPGSMRNFALMFGGERAWRSWGELLHGVQTGESGTRRVYGVGSFEYLAANPDQAIIFNEAMAENTRRITQALVSAYDFSKYSKIIDVGGGNGALMAAILGANPNTRGVVFDLPRGSAEASQKLADAGVAARCEVVAGNFFRLVPEGGDAYILKHVIHDWDDQQSAAILTNCRKAMHPASKVLLVERIMPEKMEATAANQRMAMFDINMLAMPGGQERTGKEYRDLFAKAGLSIAQCLAIPGLDIGLIEAIRN
jgi:ubiquinone/menaquinone biosynthesis C-methylase UbiE